MFRHLGFPLTSDPTRQARLAQFVRFVLVGGLNTLVGYSLFAGLYLMSGDHRLALLVATILGVLFNFVTTGRLVFGNRRWGRLPLFVGIYALSFALNLGALELLAAAGVAPLLGQLLVLPAVVVLSFLGNRLVVFRGGP
ncbi:GtrA family protein [Ancylobacter sp.]|uniref:GtrA family protein n=1 Tax=Ancylobacter sp. TaxID=1872567 RepID=UPI003C799F64